MYNDNSSAPQIRNSVIWGNDASANLGIHGGTPEVYYSIVQDGGYPSSNPVPGTNYNLTVNPLFVSPQNASAAPTTGGNYRLQSTSPAINAGSNSYYDPSITTKDLDGMDRIKGGTIDMGAYEKE
jgi:hypothetical protein